MIPMIMIDNFYDDQHSLITFYDNLGPHKKKYIYTLGGSPL